MGLLTVSFKSKKKVEEVEINKPIRYLETEERDWGEGRGRKVPKEFAMRKRLALISALGWGRERWKFIMLEIFHKTETRGPR